MIKMSGMSNIFFISLLLMVVRFMVIAVIVYFVIRASLKYIHSSDARNKKAEMKTTLGQRIKAQRIACQMTQEFVANSLGVSRQAVSKWESGQSDPSTSNLLALARLYNISVEELLKGI